MKYIAILALAFTALAQESDAAKKDQAKPEAPKISAELRAAYWRAYADVKASEQNLANANQALRDKFASLTNACGATAILRADAKGEPYCELKPEEPKK